MQGFHKINKTEKKENIKDQVNNLIIKMKGSS